MVKNTYTTNTCRRDRVLIHYINHKTLSTEYSQFLTASPKTLATKKKDQASRTSSLLSNSKVI